MRLNPSPTKGDTAVGPLGRSLRTDLASGNRETEGNDTPQVDPSRFVSRVAKAVQTANDRGGPLQLRLSPPELGSLKIQLTLKDGGLSASLEADNSNARKLLLDHLPALRDRLADQNIRVDRFDVDVKQENSGGQANSRGSNQNPYQQQEQQGGTRRTQTSGVPAPETIASAIRNSSDERNQHRDQFGDLTRAQLQQSLLTSPHTGGEETYGRRYSTCYHKSFVVIVVELLEQLGDDGRNQ